MKLVRLIGLAVILTGALSAVFANDAAPAADDEDRWVRVTKPTPILVERDHNAEIIRLAKRGEYLDLRTAGDLWYKVDVNERPGYMDAKNGVVVNKKGNPYVAIILFAIIFMLGCAGCVMFVIKKKQAATS